MWLATQGYVQSQSDQTNITTLLSQLISRWSMMIRSELERPWILPRTYVNEAYDGTGGNRQFLHHWPITNVESVSVNQQLIHSASTIGAGGVITPSCGCGWVVDEWDGIPPGNPQSLQMVGGSFPMGQLNVMVTYSAGYLTPKESQIIPPPDPTALPPLDTISVVTVDQIQGIWAQDMGVTYNDGTPLVYVPYPNLPTAAGQYTVVPPDQGTPPAPLTPPGVYQFFQDDAGQQVLISYGFIPADLEQVTIEMTCERFLYRSRIGEVSRTVAQQVTARYNVEEIPHYAKPVLQRYRNILPM